MISGFRFPTHLNPPQKALTSGTHTPFLLVLPSNKNPAYITVPQRLTVVSCSGFLLAIDFAAEFQSNSHSIPSQFVPFSVDHFWPACCRRDFVPCFIAKQAYEWVFFSPQEWETSTSLRKALCCNNCKSWTLSNPALGTYFQVENTVDFDMVQASSKSNHPGIIFAVRHGLTLQQYTFGMSLIHQHKDTLH